MLRFQGQRMILRVGDGREIPISLDRYPTLQNASPAQRRAWHLIGSDRGFYWPDLDLDLSIEGLLNGIPEGIPRPPPLECFRVYQDGFAYGMVRPVVIIASRQERPNSAVRAEAFVWLVDYERKSATFRQKVITYSPNGQAQAPFRIDARFLADEALTYALVLVRNAQVSYHKRAGDERFLKDIELHETESGTLLRLWLEGLVNKAVEETLQMTACSVLADFLRRVVAVQPLVAHDKHRPGEATSRKRAG